MKKHDFLMAMTGFLVSLALMGCFSQPASQDAAAPAPSGPTIQKGDAPEWFNETPYAEDKIYGVGLAKFANQNQSKTMAENRARVSISQELGTQVKNMIDDYTAGSEYAQAGDQFSRDVARSLSEANLVGARIEKRYIAQDGTVYALASYPKQNALKDFNSAVEKAKLDHAEFKNWQAQKEMEEAFFKTKMSGEPVSE